MESIVEEAKQLFKKLKIYSLLDLALIIPTSYNDTTLSTTLELGKVNTLEAKVVDSSIYNGKLRITFNVTQSGRRLSSTFFRVTPYHHKLFEVVLLMLFRESLKSIMGTCKWHNPSPLNR